MEQSRLDVIQAVTTDPDNFAGVIQTQDGGLVVFFVGTNAGRPNVESKIPPGLVVQWRRVERSYTYLTRVLREISDRNMDGVSAVSIDVVNNRVGVRVTQPDQLLSVSLMLAAEYGDAVLVTGGPPILVH